MAIVKIPQSGSLSVQSAAVPFIRVLEMPPAEGEHLTKTASGS